MHCWYYWQTYIVSTWISVAGFNPTAWKIYLSLGYKFLGIVLNLINHLSVQWSECCHALNSSTMNIDKEIIIKIHFLVLKQNFRRKKLIFQHYIVINRTILYFCTIVLKCQGWYHTTTTIKNKKANADMVYTMCRALY